MTTTSINNMLNTMQTYTAKMQAEQSKQNMGSDKLDKNAFLRLLMEQVKNQDPLKPMDNMQFLQQQATLSQVEEMQNLSKTMTDINGFAMSSSLIGKTVTVQDPDNAENYLTGVVSAAYTSDNGVAIEMGDKAYPIDLIRRVQNTEQTQQ